MFSNTTTTSFKGYEVLQIAKETDPEEVGGREEMSGSVHTLNDSFELRCKLMDEKAVVVFSFTVILTKAYHGHFIKI